MAPDLEGATVLVAGASRGIGLEIAKRFLEEGAVTTLAAREGSALQESVTALADDHGQRVKSFVGDLTRTEEIRRCHDERGPFDVTVINYGDTESEPGLDFSDETWNRLIDANLNGPMRLARETGSLMTERRRGSILFIGSIAGLERLGAPIAYAAGKLALSAVIKSLAWELGRYGVRVNLIAPGNILFEGGRWAAKYSAAPEKTEQMLKDKVALRRFGTPREVADVAIFLASEKASFITGSVVVVDGGQSIGF